MAVQVCPDLPRQWHPKLNVVYFPQLGYLISLPLQDPSIVNQDYESAGLEFQFSTESTAFFKNSKMHDLDESLGDLHSIICDQEIEIIQKLCESILEFAKEILQMVDAIAELDV